MNAGTECSFEDLLTFAHQLADASAEAIMPFFRARGAVENKGEKGSFDPVTAADRAAEEVIRALVEREMPAHALLGEEFGDHVPAGGGEAEYRWIIDPIDGTRSFISGIPLWGTLIGLERGGAMLLGIMNQPFTGERYWSDETSAWYRGPEGTRTLATRPCPRLSEATLLSTGPEFFADPQDLARFEDLSTRVNMRRFGGDCYCYCMLASGHVDLVVEAGLAAYDIAALVPIIERAGGRITTWEGEDASKGGRIVASGDPVLHDAALECLAGAAAS